MEAHFLRERHDDERWGAGWLRVSRLDVEPLGLALTSASRQDDEYVYLADTDEEGEDLQSFYSAMIARGAMSERANPHVITLRGDRVTFEWQDAPSPIHDLALATETCPWCSELAITGDGFFCYQCKP